MQELVKNNIIKLLLVMATFFLCFVFAEFVLRFTSYKEIFNRTYTYPDHYFVSDKDLGYDIGNNIRDKKHDFRSYPYDVYSNQFGCFDVERDIPDK